MIIPGHNVKNATLRYAPELISIRERMTLNQAPSQVKLVITNHEAVFDINVLLMSGSKLISESKYTKMGQDFMNSYLWSHGGYFSKKKCKTREVEL